MWWDFYGQWESKGREMGKEKGRGRYYEGGGTPRTTSVAKNSERMLGRTRFLFSKGPFELCWRRVWILRCEATVCFGTQFNTVLLHARSEHPKTCKHARTTMWCLCGSPIMSLFSDVEQPILDGRQRECCNSWRGREGLAQRLARDD